MARSLGARCELLSEWELSLKLSSPDEKRSVMQDLAGKYDIDEIRVFEPSLNDIFVQYAGSQV